MPVGIPMQSLTPFLYIVVLYGAFIAGSLHLRAAAPAAMPQQRITLPVMTILMAVAIGIPTMLQFVFPTILTTLERDTTRFLAGDWWRIVTALFVQDGGVIGSVFNLVSLLLVGSVAERVWGRRRWLMVFFGCGVLSEIVGLAWQPVGAGNSVANFGLAASVAAWCLVSSRLLPVRLVAAVALLAGVPLLLLRDIHGAATLFGAGMGLILVVLNHSSFVRKQA
jgi:membrane associated rhomboid family serine protease